MVVKAGKPIVIYDSLMNRDEVSAQFFGSPNQGPPVIFGFEPWVKIPLIGPPLPGMSGMPSKPSMTSPAGFIDRVKPPFIDVRLSPIKIKRADFHGDRVELEIYTKVINKSKPGYKWKENPKTGERKNIVPVHKSGDFFGIFKYPLKIINNISVDVQRGFKTISPKMELIVKKKVVKRGGIYGALRNIWSYWRRKQIYVDTTADVTVKYNWMGKLETHRCKLPLKGYLPVERGCVHFTRWHKKCF